MEQKQHKSSQAQSAAAKRYHQRHFEEIQQKRRTYYLLNKERINKRTKAYQKAHHPCPTCGILISYRASHCAKHAARPKGINSGTWKGGRHINKKGYVFIYAPEHPRAHRNQVPEHIIIWEQTNGKPLPDGWVIHHLNGIKTDNRPHNLLGMPAKKHNRFIPLLQKRIQELEAELNKQYQLL